jgi:hypothetical protein
MNRKFLVLCYLVIMLIWPYNLVCQTNDSTSYSVVLLNKDKTQITSNLQIYMSDSLGNTYHSNTSITNNLVRNRTYLIQIYTKGFFSIEKRLFLFKPNTIDTIKLQAFNDIKGFYIHVDSVKRDAFNDSSLIDFGVKYPCNNLRITVYNFLSNDSLYKELLNEVIWSILNYRNDPSLTISFLFEVDLIGDRIILFKCLEDYGTKRNE